MQDPGVPTAAAFLVANAAKRVSVLKLLLSLILLALCWPLALLAVLLYPFVWLVLLPFRLVGLAVSGFFELIGALLSLPGRVIRQL